MPLEAEPDRDPSRALAAALEGLRRAERRVAVLTDTVLRYRANHLENVGHVVAACGALYGARAAAYWRLSPGGALRVLSRWRCGSAAKEIASKDAASRGSAAVTRDASTRDAASEDDDLERTFGPRLRDALARGETAPFLLRDDATLGRSTAYVVRSRAAPLGVLVIIDAKETPETPAAAEDRKLLDALVSAIAVEEGRHRDAESLREREERLHQAQKLEAIGQLAGGIAHDFNNLLMVILGSTELAASSLGAEHPVRPDLDAIRGAGGRAKALVAQLLAYSRRQVIEPRTLSVNRVVEDALDMLTRLLGEEVRLRTRLSPAIGLVRIDAAQMTQVLLNLTVNARDAMPRGGEITIETREETVAAEAGDEGDDGSRSRPPGLASGRHVVLSVRDEGAGMSPETRARLFEPFFTTKGPGRGTGLGLSTVYGIVKGLHGEIDVETRPGAGTTFRTYLPCVDPDAAPPRVEEDVRAGGGRGETVLLVEDEASVRHVAARILTAAGYAVLEAPDGERALEVARAHDGPIDLLATDQRMPRLSGTELARRLSAIHPRMPVLFLSGYADEARPDVAAGTAFLPKPYAGEELARMVRALIDGAGVGAAIPDREEVRQG